MMSQSQLDPGGSSGNNLEKRVKTYESWDYNIKVAGVSFCQPELAQLYSKIWEHIEIDLVREPDNEYDPNAIRVDADGLKVGYIPGIVAQVMGPQIDSGSKFDAKVIFVTAAEGKKIHTIKLALNRR